VSPVAAGVASDGPVVDIDALLARCTFPPPDGGGDVPLAVSGGADSLALLVLARRRGLAVTAWHVDHGLRPGSSREAEVVRAVAAEWGAGFRAVCVEVEPGPNLEARARRARYDALPDGTLTGHTADDQAETVLLFLMRGTGPAGLAGIAPDRHPLLGLRRAETQALCASLGIAPVDDPTNRDARFRRNRIRHELLPLMSAIAERDVVPLIARTAALQRSEQEVIGESVSGIDATDATALTTLPAATARAALRRWFLEVTGAPYGPDAAALERMRQVGVGAIGAIDCGGGWRVERSGGRLELRHAMVSGDGIR
jgi:tRNA(Ile)-lysidine synthase